MNSGPFGQCVLTDQVQIDLLFNFPVRQVVEKLWFDVAHHSELVEEQKHNFRQYQRIPGGTTIRFRERDEASAESLVRTVAIPYQLRDKVEIYSCGDPAQQMIGSDKLVVNHAEEAALGTVLSLDCSNRQPMKFPELAMILAQPLLDRTPLAII